MGRDYPETAPLSGTYSDKYSLDKKDVTIQDNDYQIQAEEAPNKNGLGFIGATFNVTSSVLGGGILSFPYAFAAAGLVGGVVATLVLVTFAYVALMVIIVTYEKYCKNKAKSYQAVVLAVFGRNVELLMIISIAIYSFGSCIAFLVIVGDQLVPVVESITNYFDADTTATWYSVIVSRAFIISSTTILVIFPLCIMKKIDALKYSSFLATIMVYFFTFVIIYYAFAGTVDSENNNQETIPLATSFSEAFSNVKWLDLSFQFFQCAPIICFAFQCHLSIVPIYGAMEDQKVTKAGGICAIALANCTFLYLAAGIFGYLTFFCSTESDILKNYDDTSIPVLICRLGMALVACFAYPIMNFVERLSINDLFLWFAPVCKYQVKETRIENSPLRYYPVTIIFTIAALLLAIFVPTINAVVSLLGAVFAVLFIFGFPGLFLFALSKRSNKKPLYIAIGVLFIVVGVLVSLISLAVSLYNDINVIVNDVEPSACAVSS